MKGRWVERGPRVEVTAETSIPADISATLTKLIRHDDFRKPLVV